MKKNVCKVVENDSLRLILRFRKSERLLHWAIAVPFVICWSTGITLLLFYNLHSSSSVRHALAWIHRGAGACLLLFPVLVAVWNRADYMLHLANIREALRWRASDLMWLVLMGPSMVSRRVKLPDQGKFNAAEKINFIMVLSTYFPFIVTGVVLSLPGTAFLSWLVHVGMALLATPLMLGHIYMALINPETRVGLGGMISGHVNRAWARHHYALWYRQHHGADEPPALEADAETEAEPEPEPERPILESNAPAQARLENGDLQQA